MIADRTLQVLEFDKVLSHLAECTSFSAGRDLALALRPSTELEEVRQRLGEVTEARALLEVRPTISLGGVHDVRAAARRAELGAVLRAEELLAVADTLSAADRFRATVSRVETEIPWVHRMTTALVSCPDIVERVQETFGERGEVLDSASSRLRSVRHEIRTAHGRLMDRLNSMLTSADYRTLLQEPVVMMRNGRYVVPVKSDARARLPGIVHDQSASGQTVFVEPIAITELNNRWRTLQIEEEQEIERILEALSQLVGGRAGTIVTMVEALAELDLALARARYASRLEASTPNINAEGRTDLIQARHPLLTGSVVPITVSLGESHSILVITGPNTGGKTVALKTVGLLTLMTQAGMQIPSEAHSSVAIFRRIWADIGDEQSIEQSLSTFSSHLRNIVQILRETGPDTLVLLDELGAGTDPAEGSALARAIIIDLLERGARAIATTHYSELKAFAHEQQRVENASVEFNVQTLSPTYRLIVGLPGRSQALAIARRLGLPPPIVERARSFVSQTGVRVDRLLATIQQERRAIGNLYRRAIELNEDMTKLRDRLQQEVEATREERQRVFEEAQAEANEVVRSLRKQLLELESEARQHADVSSHQAASRGQVSSIRARIEEARDDALQQLHGAAEDQAEAVEPADGALAAGDEVEVQSLSQRGTVLSVDGKQAQVQVGSFTLRRPVEDLQRLKRQPTAHTGGRKVVTPGVTVTVAPTTTPLEVDVRGWRPGDVEPYLERYINDSYMTGRDTLRIVHGHGTGALRRAVREQLESHPLVAGFAPADKGGGGEGVTVVTLSG